MSPRAQTTASGIGRCEASTAEHRQAHAADGAQAVVAASRQETQRRTAIELVLQNPSRYRDVAARWVRPWLTNLLQSVCPSADSLTVRFTGDREMRRLNRTYRGKDATTDVLTFPGERTVEGLHLGDLIVSVPTARRQAEIAEHSPGHEIKTLLLHGVLHCLGYDHESDGGEMVKLESRLRRRFLV